MIIVYVPLLIMKLIGLVLAFFSVLSLIFGTAPGENKNDVDDIELVANGLRWLFWPLFVSWFLWIFIRGLVN